MRPSSSSRYNAPALPGVDYYEKLLTDNLGLLRQVVRNVARRHCLKDDDTEDLLGSIHLKLIDNDYAVLRRFEGASKLSTYLTTVVSNHVLDERNKRLGRWRHSIYARRAGRAAMLLEELVVCRGLSFDEAVQTLKTNYQVAESEEELYRVSLGLPTRVPRRFVDIGSMEVPAEASDPDEALDQERRAMLAQRTSVALTAACARLEPPDRLLLRLYFEKDLELSKIAKMMKVDQKPLYRRKDRVLAVLASELEYKGITRAEIREILGEELAVDLSGAGDVGNQADASV